MLSTCARRDFSYRSIYRRKRIRKQTIKLKILSQGLLDARRHSSLSEEIRRFAYFGSRAPRLGFSSPPEGGFCLSSFVLVMRRRSILLEKAAESDEWEHLTGMDEERVRMLAKEGKWLIPSSHLIFGEHPKDAAKRVFEEQLCVKRYSLKFLAVLSGIGETRRYAGRPHLDICFVYSGKLRGTLKRPDWLSELTYVDARRLRPSYFGRDHEGVLEQLGM